MSSTGGGIVVHAQQQVDVTRNGKTLTAINNTDNDVSLDEATLTALVEASCNPSGRIVWAQ